MFISDWVAPVSTEMYVNTFNLYCQHWQLLICI